MKISVVLKWLTGVLLAVAVACGGGSSSNPNSPPSSPGDITADFGSRQTQQFPIPPGLIGASLGFTANNFFHNQAALSTLVRAGISSLLVNADLQDIYAATTPDWTQIDSLMTNFRAAGIHPLVEMAYTPFSLQPNPNPCGSASPPYHAVPTDVNAWAGLAAAFVAHMNHVFPGLVQDYEIWNEPDQQAGLCTATDSDQARLNAYLSLYSAAAQAMRLQANSDRMQIRLGGPSLTTAGNAPVWLPALLSNSATAPNVDFISYHEYLAGNTAISAGLTWADDTATESVVSRTQDPATGVTAKFIQVSTLVHNGSQPNAANTPIFLDEYNITASFEPDCCRNSPTYAPVWNTMVIQDGLNSVYSGASSVPGKLMYFAAQAFFPNSTTGAAWFCLIGTIDARMDCAYDPSNAQPYPQYYAYNLMGPSFLGLSAGGFMANSVSVGANAAGLIVTSFYTSNKLAIVISNPTQSDFSNLTVKAQHPGSVGSQATMYVLNNSNPKISQQSLALTSISDGMKATVSVPHLSVVAIAVPTS